LQLLNSTAIYKIG